MPRLVGRKSDGGLRATVVAFLLVVGLAALEWYGVINLLPYLGAL